MISLRSRRGKTSRTADEQREGPSEEDHTAGIAYQPVSDTAVSSVDPQPPSEESGPGTTGRHRRRAAIIVFAVMPAVVISLAAAAGSLKWQGASRHDAREAAQETPRVAAEAAVALLSYQPDTVQADLDSAKSNLTGDFLDAYSRLIDELVIPGAREKQISAIATVPAAASTSATSDRAVVLLFVNQTTTIGADAPTSTASTVRVTLDRVDNRWLISQFEPV